MQQWQNLGHKVEIIDPTTLLQTAARQQTPVASPLPPPAGSSGRTDKLEAPGISLSLRPTPPPLPFPREIMAMLFADAVGFSKLIEEEIPRFVQHFLGAIAELADRSPYAPVTRNTWGDGLYFVFTSVRDAGRFALDLCDLVNSTKWAEKGLPEELNLRIALHAGPVYVCTNPVTGQPDYIGVHVSRAARIEPITPPGQIYASQSFAAVAAAQKVNDFTYDYVGQVPLAKGYGTFPTYHVRRRYS